MIHDSVSGRGVARRVNMSKLLYGTRSLILMGTNVVQVHVGDNFKKETAERGKHARRAAFRCFFFKKGPFRLAAQQLSRLSTNLDKAAQKTRTHPKQKAAL